MGLTNWRGEKVRKDDVPVAKNYLNEEELAALNNLVEQYLVFAEGQAMRRIPMRMADWIKKLNDFLSINERAILDMPVRFPMNWRSNTRKRNTKYFSRSASPRKTGNRRILTK